MDNVSYLDIQGFTDVIRMNGRFYYLHDLELRDRIDGDSLKEDYLTLPTSAVVYKAVEKKLDKSEYEDLSESLSTVATTGNFNDLQDRPYVEGSTLIFR